MSDIKLTTEDFVNIACHAFSQVIERYLGTTQSVPAYSFRYAIENQIDKVVNGKNRTKMCNKCNQEKRTDEFYRNRSRWGNIDSMCKDCRKSDISKCYLARQKSVIKDDPHLSELSERKISIRSTDKGTQYDSIIKEQNRIYAYKNYYEEDRFYLLSKYLKRHQIQLTICLDKIGNVEKELNEGKEMDRLTVLKKKKILVRMQAKRDRIKEYIVKEKKLIQDIELKRKEPTHE